MRKLGGNSILEMWAEDSSGKKLVMWHDRQALDARAKLMIDLVKMSLHTTPLVNAMHGMTETAPHRQQEGQPSITETVMRAAEIVDAIYDEAQRRGWAIDLPDYGEIWGE